MSLISEHAPVGIGFELELNGNVSRVTALLAEEGWCTDRMHDYHCRCSECNYQTGRLWRFQRDSTVDGEFISRPFYDWPTAIHALRVMANAIARAKRDGDVEVGQNTGLHIHVSGFGTERAGTDARRRILDGWLRNERWIQRIGSGPFADKREGMNITALTAVRQQGRHLVDGNRIAYAEAAGMVENQIMADRHVDLNFSTRANTIEYRVFNSTCEAWQMELAARTAVAFTKAATNAHLNAYAGFPQTFVMPATALTTLVPDAPFGQFANILSAHDQQLLPLIKRQLKLHRVEVDWDERYILPTTPEPAADSSSVAPRATSTAAAANHTPAPLDGVTEVTLTRHIADVLADAWDAGSDGLPTQRWLDSQEEDFNRQWFCLRERDVTFEESNRRMRRMAFFESIGYEEDDDIRDALAPYIDFTFEAEVGEGPVSSYYEDDDDEDDDED